MDKYVKHYNDHYLQMAEHGSGQLIWRPQYKQWIKAGYNPDLSVLDYGCGIGIMTECGIDPKLYYGVDISEEAIRIARNHYPKYNFEVIKPGKFDGQPYDICVAQSVITHTPKILVPECLNNIKEHFIKFAIIDILLGEDNPSDYHVRHYEPDEWLDYLWKLHLKGEEIGRHTFAGYEHIYYKVTHD